ARLIKARQPVSGNYMIKPTHRTSSATVRLPSTWLLAASAIAAAPAIAQVAEEEVFVLGQRLEETIPLDLQQFGNRVEVITADQLELGGFNDLGQSLQMKVPGLYVAPRNGPFDYM